MSNEATDNYVVSMVLNYAEIRKKNHPAREGDYEVDGILTCGTCHKPRRRWQKIGDQDVLVYTMCDCDKAAKLKEEAEEERQRKAKSISELREKSRMDYKYVGSTFDSLIINECNSKPIGICRRYAEKFPELMKKGQGLLLYGSVGTGKTVAAACIANAVLEKEMSVIMTSFTTLLSEIQALSSYHVGDTEADYIDRMNNAALWVIDDLGAERNTTYALEKVYMIVDSRYRTGKSTVYTTNMTLDEIMNTNDIRYKRIYDRILEQCYPVFFNGPSWRMKEAKRRFSLMSELLEDDGRQS